MVTLAAAATVTKTIPIGLSIGSPYMRHPKFRPPKLVRWTNCPAAAS